MLTAYSFVLVWHGLKLHYAIWVALNIIELLVGGLRQDYLLGKK